MHCFKINPDNPQPDLIRQAAQVIRAGGIIVYPTDTLYGFGIDLNNRQALAILSVLKCREVQKPISVLVNSRAQAEWLVGPFNPEESACFSKLMPGKITLVLPRRIPAPFPLYEQSDKIGIRYPVSKICDRLIAELGYPISSTSVNVTGQPNLKNAEEIERTFGEQIDLILDAGPVKSLRGSTVLDCASFPPQLIREGDIGADQIGKILGAQLKLPAKKFMILFICSGNICRSPMAEGILKRVLSKTKYKNIVDVRSAGTLKIENAPAAPEAIEIASQYDIPLFKHKSHGLNRKIMSRANLVFCMALNHLNYIDSNFPEFKNKVFLLKQWQENKSLSNPSIADPIGHHSDFFKKIFNQIYIEIMRVLPEIFKLLKAFSEQTERNDIKT
jgi:L-threonylcarbamoyladenylate synthase